MKRFKYQTHTTTSPELRVYRLMSDATPQERAKLYTCDLLTKALLADAYRQGHHPPESVEEYGAAMEAIEGFMLSRRPSPEVTADVGELLLQLWEDSKKFPRLLRTKLASALQAERERTAVLQNLLDEVTDEVILKLFEKHSDVTHAALTTLLNQVRTRLEQYDGEADDRADFIQWISDSVEEQLKRRAEERAREKEVTAKFTAMYTAGKKSLKAGIWSVLKGCEDLGADKAEVEEVAQRAWIKVWQRFQSWEKKGPATITTRLYDFGRAQALGWRTQRLRDREKFRSLFAVDDDPDERQGRELRRAA
jgi:hypothetical protein